MKPFEELAAAKAHDVANEVASRSTRYMVSNNRGDLNERIAACADHYRWGLYQMETLERNLRNYDAGFIKDGEELPR